MTLALTDGRLRELAAICQRVAEKAATKIDAASVEFGQHNSDLAALARAVIEARELAAKWRVAAMTPGDALLESLSDPGKVASHGFNLCADELRAIIGGTDA